MEIVLVHPEIPQNTGSTARLAAAIDVRLHLVEPLGFSLDSRHLKRAGLDYWPDVDMRVHSSWQALLEALADGSDRPVMERLKLFTARGGESLFAVEFRPDDVLVFGCESEGLPADLLKENAQRRIRVPTRSSVRSLNLASIVCLGAYTALDRANGQRLFDDE
ncbi:MAG: tRNA (cytidine(34)-2'-O)-methyltransferase [bacterium]|nr:tRNA (cytidine(34)-2'-O)-methyltransferase [bacterium]